MPNLIECGKNKLDDPILMNWALRRYEQAQVRSPDLSRAMEEAWFDEPALRRWLDAGDDETLTRLFRILPVRLFSNLKPTIVERWENWDGPLAGRATAVLMECPLEEVLALLARHVEGNLADVEKTLAVIEALPRLPKANGLELIEGIAGRLAKVEDVNFTKQMLLEALLRPMAVLNLSGLARLTEMCARADGDGNKSNAERLTRAVDFALFDNMALWDNAKYTRGNEKPSTFRSLQLLFADGAPLEECDRILAEADPWPAAKELLEKHRSASAATEIALPLVEIFRSMDGAEDADMACFAVSVVLSAFERDDIGADRLSLEEALHVLTLDLSENRHIDGLTQRLRAFPPVDVAQAVSERMPAVKNDWGGVRLATLAGELRLVDAIPILIGSLRNKRGDFLCEAAANSLALLGEPALAALIAQWDGFDGSQKIYGRGVLEQAGGPLAREFAVDRFRELFGDDSENWCDLAEAVPDARAADLLAPELRRKQPWIDECFYLLCTLTGHEHPRLE
ncbi:MAG: hypothetical protein ACREC6_14665, partial [Hyphomicrobiaceae bacterium]